MDFTDYYGNTLSKVRKEIEEMEADRLIHTEKRAIVEYFLRMYALPILEKDSSRDIQAEFGRGDRSVIPVRVTYPLKNADKIGMTAQSKPNSWTYGGGIDVSFDRVSRSFWGDTQLRISPSEGAKSPKDVIDRIELNIQEINNSVNAGNSEIARTASETYDQTKKEDKTRQRRLTDGWRKHQ